MNRKVFYDRIRGAYGPLSSASVAGMEALLDEGQRAALPIWHLAHVLGHVKRETGGYMAPIKETVYAGHKDKNPSDAEVIRRLDKAFAAGKLEWVKAPYWRTGFFGRGQIQLTHETGYRENSDIAGVDLVRNKSAALEPAVSAKIAIWGMKLGRFTGKKLADYTFPEALDNAPKYNPRRIVNGVDGSDAEVAAATRLFHSALKAAGYNPALDTPAPAPDISVKPQAGRGILAAIFAAIVAAFRNLMKGK